jgi:hypothetical protein
METRFIAILLFASLLVLIVGAQPAPPALNADRTALLESALKDMGCKVTYETGIMNAMISKFPSLSPSLSPYIGKLQTDLAQLTQYFNQKDIQNYSIYVQETFTPNMIDANIAQRKGIEGLRDNSGMDKNATKTAMRALKSEMESLRAANEICFDMKTHAGLVINYYTNSLDMYEKRANNLSERNIGATVLSNLVAEARQNILNPLKDEVNSAQNNSQIKAALMKYCLFDGCLNGTNFHMAAKYETARLQILLNVVSVEAVNIDLDNNGYPDRDEIKIALDHVDEIIDSWANVNANSGQLRTEWDNIRSAAKKIHALFVEINKKDVE